MTMNMDQAADRHPPTPTRMMPRAARAGVIAATTLALAAAVYLIIVRHETLFIDLVAAGRAILCL
jgi:hypothetical protein